MDQAGIDRRLNQISTVWTLVRRAHSDDSTERLQAQVVLLERYQRAIYRFLLQSVHYDADGADELFQDFALRFSRGDFQAVDPSRGRFRDYLKTVLINQVINHLRQRGKLRHLDSSIAKNLTDVRGLKDPQATFMECWRKEILDRAWEGLAAQQRAEGPPYHTALRTHFERGNLSTAELAQELSTRLRPDEPYTEVAIRKVLQRAREKFAELLLEETSQSIQTASLDDIEQELRDLGFWPYCSAAVKKRRGD
jgi:RNA polymerase sigma-70 factor (ECF subfamily)